VPANLHGKRNAKNSETKIYCKNGGVSELLKELWNAAVALRGSIETA
jgi:hypothetical protein